MLNRLPKVCSFPWKHCTKKHLYNISQFSVSNICSKIIYFTLSLGFKTKTFQTLKQLRHGLWWKKNSRQNIATKKNLLLPLSMDIKTIFAGVVYG
jgi:hypothetical protein